MTSPSTSRRALLAGGASSLLLAACGGGGGSSSGGSANVRLLNLSSDVASVDLYAGDSKLLAAGTTDALSSFKAVDAASYTLKVTRANDAASLLSGTYALAKDQHYTAVVWGRETALRLHTLPEDELTTDITAGNSRLRVFNATTDSGTLDTYLTASTTDIAETTPTQSGLGAGVLGGFKDLTAGTYRLRVTGLSDPNDLRLDIASITLKEKEYATLILTAGSGGVLVHATLLVQQGAGTAMKNTKARVRLLASVGNAGNVAVQLAGRTLVGGLRSPSVGPYALVDAGDLDLTVRVNGNTVTSGVRTLSPGADYTLLTMGTADASQVKLLTDDNRLPGTSGRCKVRLLNGLSIADPLTLSIDFAALAIDVASGTASAYANTASSSAVRVDVTAATGATALYSTDSVNLQSLGIYTVFMLDGNTTVTGVIRKER